MMAFSHAPFFLGALAMGLSIGPSFADDTVSKVTVEAHTRSEERRVGKECRL